MKVYVVLEMNETTEYEYCGVFATPEKAKERIIELAKEFGLEEEKLYIVVEEV